MSDRFAQGLTFGDEAPLILFMTNDFANVEPPHASHASHAPHAHTMRSCPECGCARMVDGKPCPFQPPHAEKVLRVPALQCNDCGRTFPVPGIIDAIMAPFRAATVRPPGAYPIACG